MEKLGSQTSKESQSSYSEIVSSSSIIGGSALIGVLVSMVRGKAAALLLGPGGLGVVGLYQNLMSMVATITGFGLSSSSARTVADSRVAGGSPVAARWAVVVLAVGAGVLGCAVVLIGAGPLAQATFGSDANVGDVRLAGLGLVPLALFAGWAGILQGERRTAEVARLSIASAVLGALASIGGYAVWGVRAVPAVFVAVATIQCALAAHLARRGSGEPTPRPALSEVRRYLVPLLRLGGAFVWTGSIATLVTFLVGTTISTTLGVTAFGQYQAAWTVSGVFAQFILVAMGADLLPRLTAAAADKAHLNQMVNEQTEVGLLLSLPGLAATVFFAPIIVRLLFSSEFTAGATVLPWLVLGVLGRVVTWPLGYLLIAKGESLVFAVAETLTALFQLAAVYLLVDRFQLLGAALAFPLTYIVYAVVGLWSTSRVSGFRWSRDVKLLLVSVMLPAVVLVIATRLLSMGLMVALGCVVCPLVAVGAGRRLARRLGATHRFVALLSRHGWAARLLALPEP